MPKRVLTLFAVGLLMSFAFGKDKNKRILPAYVLSAHTVAVITEPGAGISLDDPRANENARKDVETALLSWGRFEPVLSTQGADLIITVRKGTGRSVAETIPDGRQNNRPGDITTADNGISLGGQHGGSRPSAQPGLGPGQGPAGPQTEIGGADDSFVVYEGGNENPLDAPPAWRYMAKDGLAPHSVPAVEAFKKAVAEAEKAAAKKP
jgi:hypothetical protein